VGELRDKNFVLVSENGGKNEAFKPSMVFLQVKVWVMRSIDIWQILPI
jgi:hypothetical protein